MLVLAEQWRRRRSCLCRWLGSPVCHHRSLFACLMVGSWLTPAYLLSFSKWQAQPSFSGGKCNLAAKELAFGARRRSAVHNICSLIACSRNSYPQCSESCRSTKIVRLRFRPWVLFASSMSFGSFRLARHLSGQVFRTFSVWGSVGVCLWPQHALSLQHLSQERINIVDAVAAALGALAAAAAAEEGP